MDNRTGPQMRKQAYPKATASPKVMGMTNEDLQPRCVFSATKATVAEENQ